MSEGLTNDEVQQVRVNLSDIAKFRIFPQIVQTALFTMFTVLICVSTGVLISKGLRRGSNRSMLILTLFMYSASALEWSIGTRAMWNELNIFLPGLLSPTTQPGRHIKSTLLALDGVWFFASQVSYQINLLLSDAVVLWRVCVVWDCHKGVVGATALILACLVGVSLLYILPNAVVYLPSTTKSLAPLSNDLNTFSIVLFSLSTFANVWATGMVAYKAWIHRRNIRRYLQNRTAKGAVENILMLLVESGIVYSVITIMLLLMSCPSIHPLYSGPFLYYWDVITAQICGMYPTLIIVLVAMQKSHLEHQFSYVGKGPDATLPFSVRVPQSRLPEGTSAQELHADFQLEASDDVLDSDVVSESDTSPDVFAPQEKGPFSA
ncbi:hypothetical protein OF83DRAFT_1177168 [Amylostereum chailletii]|nr:hypothetical protein OF83DRAFT_1177168 [Amylostereum chailletii]